MANSPRDDNRNVAIGAASSAGPTTYTPLVADPVTQRLKVEATVSSISGSGGTGMNGGKVSVTTTPVELTFTGTPKAISIKTLSTNTASVYIGLSSVDSSGNNAITEITADGFFSVELDDTSLALYAVAASGSQTIFKSALT